MQASIHPQSSSLSVSCSGCGHKFSVLSTLNLKVLVIESCNKCHVAYTGKRKLSKTGAVERFTDKYQNFGRKSE